MTRIHKTLVGLKWAEELTKAELIEALRIATDEVNILKEELGSSIYKVSASCVYMKPGVGEE